MQSVRPSQSKIYVQRMIVDYKPTTTIFWCLCNGRADTLQAFTIIVLTSVVYWRVGGPVGYLVIPLHNLNLLWVTNLSTHRHAIFYGDSLQCVANSHRMPHKRVCIVDTTRRSRRSRSIPCTTSGIGKFRKRNALITNLRHYRSFPSDLLFSVSHDTAAIAGNSTIVTLSFRRLPALSRRLEHHWIKLAK